MHGHNFFGADEAIWSTDVNMEDVVPTQDELFDAFMS